MQSLRSTKSSSCSQRPSHAAPVRSVSGSTRPRVRPFTGPSPSSSLPGTPSIGTPAIGSITRRMANLASIATMALPASTSHDLLVVGPGVLGGYLGKLWKDAHPGSTVIGLTNTSNNHDRWGGAAGYRPCSSESGLRSLHAASSRVCLMQPCISSPSMQSSVPCGHAGASPWHSQSTLS